MFLYIDEFKERSKTYQLYGRRLENIYDGDRYFHELSVDEIKKILSEGNLKGAVTSKVAINAYIEFLWKEYFINVTDLYYDINQINLSLLKYNKEYFYSLEQLLSEGAELIENAEKAFSQQGVHHDISALMTLFILNWHGLDSNDIVTIKLTDVKGGAIYVPSRDSTIILSKKEYDIVSEYKDKIGYFQHKNRNPMYTQNTLIRSVGGTEITEKTIRNIRYQAKSVCGDDIEKFSSRNIMASGHYYKLYEYTLRIGRSITPKDYDEVCELLNVTKKSITVINRNFKSYLQIRKEWFANR